MSLEQKTMRVIHYVAAVFSFLLSPMFMPTYGMLIAFQLSTYQILLTTDKLIVIAVVAVLTCVVPAILFIVMKHFGIISDVDVSLRSGYVGSGVDGGQLLLENQRAHGWYRRTDWLAL